MIRSFWADEHLLPQIQRVVKRYDLRFHNNPAAFRGLGRALVEISSNGVDPRLVREAHDEIDRIRLPQPVAQPLGWWRGMISRMMR